MRPTRVCPFPGVGVGETAFRFLQHFIKETSKKVKQPAIAGIFGVNSTESNREQNGIIGGQIWGANW
jgi:hypothetical protein